jgi:hypothetical protein
MGIEFSHCDAHWGYTGFGRFRQKIANACGHIGNYYDNLHDDTPVEMGKYAKDIGPFLFHSDCDGELTPEEMKKIWPVLEHIVKLWDDDDYDKNQALELIDGMKFAISENEPIVFC